MHRQILVVDDDESVREALTDRFRAMGFEVVTAADGQMGLEIVRSSGIGGILLDFEMPVMDGLSMLQGLRKWHAHIPVLMMSADHNPNRVKKAIALGAIGFVPKPIDFARLKQQCLHLFG